MTDPQVLNIRFFQPDESDAVIHFSSIKTSLTVSGEDVLDAKVISRKDVAPTSWRQALDGCCYAISTLLFIFHKKSLLDKFIPWLKSKEGYSFAKRLQSQYERASYHGDTVELETLLHKERLAAPTFQQVTPWKEVSELCHKPGYYLLSISNDSATHAVGMVVEEAHTVIMDANRGLAIIANADFPKWLDTQLQEGKAWSYLNEMSSSVAVQCCAEPKLQIRANL